MIDLDLFDTKKIHKSPTSLAFGKSFRATLFILNLFRNDCTFRYPGESFFSKL